MTDMKVEARITNRTGNRAKVSVRIDMECGGISVSDIYIREINGKPHVTFPLADNQRPYVYFRGDLKKAVNAAIEEAFYQNKGQAANAGT